VQTSAALDIHLPADEGVVARLIARIDDFSPTAIHELGSDDAPIWRVFFSGSIQRDDAAVALRAEFQAQGLACEGVDVPDEDWAARSQASLRAVRVGRIVVAPPWDAAATLAHSQAGAGADGDIVIVIRPSMGFGTGHHETTRLCLELLPLARVAGREVLDVGTGSGVLAIASARLGAVRVRGIDVDEDALAAARQNVALNAPSLGNTDRSVALSAANLRDGVAPADVVVANLTGALLVSAAQLLRAAVRAGGALLVSGFQPHEADAVLEALVPPGGRADRRREGEWEAALIDRF
jgi:ribosomal protein L11 methyltransferase